MGTLETIQAYAKALSSALGAGLAAVAASGVVIPQPWGAVAAGALVALSALATAKVGPPVER